MLFFEVTQYASGRFSATCRQLNYAVQAVDLSDLHDQISQGLTERLKPDERPEMNEVHLIISREEATEIIPPIGSPVCCAL